MGAKWEQKTRRVAGSNRGTPLKRSNPSCAGVRPLQLSEGSTLPPREGTEQHKEEDANHRSDSNEDDQVLGHGDDSPKSNMDPGLLEPLRDDEAVYRLQQEHPDVGYEQESEE